MSNEFPFFNFWEQFLTLSERQRKMVLNQTLDDLRQYEDGLSVVESLTSKDWDFIGMVPSLFFYDSKSKSNTRKFLNFPFYTMLFSHKTLPLLALSNIDLKAVKGVKTNFRVNEGVMLNPSSTEGVKAGYSVGGLSFWNDFEKYTLKERHECHEESLGALSIFKKGRISEEGKKLTDLFKSGKEYRFLGMVPLMYYFRVTSRSQEDLKALWEHPFSMFTMAYEHKSLPLIILCNANIEYNDSVLAHIDGNKGLREMKDILGITG